MLHNKVVVGYDRRVRDLDAPTRAASAVIRHGK